MYPRSSNSKRLLTLAMACVVSLCCCQLRIAMAWIAPTTNTTDACAVEYLSSSNQATSNTGCCCCTQNQNDDQQPDIPNKPNCPCSIKGWITTHDDATDDETIEDDTTNQQWIAFAVGLPDDNNNVSATAQPIVAHNAARCLTPNDQSLLRQHCALII